MPNHPYHHRNDHIPLYLSFRPSPEISNEAFNANQRQVRALLKSSQDGLYPKLYADCLCSGSQIALNEYNDFLEQLSECDPARAISLHSQVMDEILTRDGHSAPLALAQPGRTASPLEKVAKLLEKKGRDGDTILAHITPAEARHLKDHGGAGTRNPETGLLEFMPRSFCRPNRGSLLEPQSGSARQRLLERNNAGDEIDTLGGETDMEDNSQNERLGGRLTDQQPEGQRQTKTEKGRLQRQTRISQLAEKKRKADLSETNARRQRANMAGATHPEETSALTDTNTDIDMDRQVRNIMTRRKEEEDRLANQRKQEDTARLAAAEQEEAELTEKQKIARDELRKADAVEEANRQAKLDAARKAQAASTEKAQITRMENYRANVSTLSMPDIPKNKSGFAANLNHVKSYKDFYHNLIGMTDVTQAIVDVAMNVFSQEGMLNKDPTGTAVAGLTQETVNDHKTAIGVPEFTPPKNLTSGQRAVAYMAEFNRVFEDAYKEGALAIQGAINAVAPDTVEVDGVIGMKSLDAYQELASVPSIRNALLDALADERAKLKPGEENRFDYFTYEN